MNKEEGLKWLSDNGFDVLCPRCWNRKIFSKNNEQAASVMVYVKSHGSIKGHFWEVELSISEEFDDGLTKLPDYSDSKNKAMCSFVFHRVQSVGLDLLLLLKEALGKLDESIVLRLRDLHGFDIKSHELFA